jgi:hypothetical protein
VRWTLWSVVVASALIAGEGRPRAALCPAMTGADPRLGAVDGRDRLTWIDARLSRVGGWAREWTWAWGGGIAASGVASLAVVPFVRPSDRVDWYTSAASAAVGVVPFLFSPLDVARDGRELHAKVVAAGFAGGPDADVCPLLADAEGRLVRDAENEHQQQAWWLHAGNIAFNTGITLFLGLGFHHWASGLINGIAGAAVGEAIIFTQPTRTIDDLRAYRSGDLGPGAALGFTGAYTAHF